MAEEEWVDPVTDAHLLAIGRVVRNWGHAERVISDSLWEVATGHSFETADEEASISLALVTGMEARVALGMLKAVFRAKHFGAADEFDKLVEKLDKLRHRRNIVAHSRWTKGERPGSIEGAAFKTSGSLGVDTHAYTAAELEALAARIMEHCRQTAKFLRRFGYWKPPKRSAPET